MKIWIVAFGLSAHVFFTEYHANQFADALRTNGTEYTLTESMVAR